MLSMQTHTDRRRLQTDSSASKDTGYSYSSQKTVFFAGNIICSHTLLSLCVPRRSKISAARLLLFVVLACL